MSVELDWTAQAAPAASGWRSVCYGNGLFVAVAYGDAYRIMTSPDGITWTAQAAPAASGWRSVCYGNGLFVAVANSGTYRIMTSPDGITWTAQAAPAASYWYSVCYGNGLFVAVADSGDYRIMTVEWAEPEPPVIIDTVPAYSPQSIVNLVFQAGDSAEYPMGKFYVDRMQYSVNTESMRIDARNSIGKYLKDQTFDERNSYEVTKVSDMLEAILSGAGLSDYYVQPNNTLLGMEFAPNKEMLEGIEEVVQYIENWQIREEVSGRVVIADKTSSEFTQPSRYTFRRDRDIFSRDVSSDDRSVYARVCVHTSDFSVKVYRPVNTNLGWNAPANKTLYQTVPDGTTSYEAAGIAVKLAESMANSGAIETFVCAFRPQIIPGDEAEILEEDESATMLGIITQVKHSFGTGGFFTEIVVDSGGRIGKPRLKEIIGTLAPPPASKRL